MNRKEFRGWIRSGALALVLLLNGRVALFGADLHGLFLLVALAIVTWLALQTVKEWP